MARVKQATDWDALARKVRRGRKARDTALYAFLMAVSLPIMVPYLWLITLAFTARETDISTAALWPSLFTMVPAVLLTWIWATLARDRRRALIGWAAIWAAALPAFLYLVGGKLHLGNFRFLVDRNFNADEVTNGSDFGSTAFPSVWTAFSNSLVIALGATVLVIAVASLAAYYISRYQYRFRSASLATVLVLHAFPVSVLLIPIFLLIWKLGLLNTLFGVMLVIIGLELPFAIFLLKGFFDAVPWELEMSAITDGATRRQAFFLIVLPQIRNGLIAAAVFAFIRGWEEFVFVLVLATSQAKWTMSLYTFFVSEENALGVNYGMVAAVALFYILPSFLLYTFAQKYLMQMQLGGVKG